MKSSKTSIFSSQHKGISLFVFMLVLGAFMFSCSVKKNNSFTRSYHNLTTRYNVYYNGEKAFDEAYKKSLEELEESYVELIPFSPIYYKAESEDALGTFQRAIEKSEKAIQEHSIRQKPKRKRGWKKDPKSVAMQKKKEYNTYLKNAWFLLGKSQYYNAEFNKSLSTFAYIANLYQSNEELHARAMLWQIRILTLLDRTSEAKELLKSLSINTQTQTLKELKGLHSKVLTEYALKNKDYTEALTYLPASIKHSKNKIQKARLYYLMGQLYLIDSIKNKEKSYKCFSKVLKLTPPQNLDFAARLRRSELSPKGINYNIRLLKRMSKKRRYQKNLDQIYYALGNSYLSLKDTTDAVQAYQVGADSSQVKKYDYLLNLMSLGRLYLSQENWLKAQAPISLVATGLSTTHKDYNYYQHLSKGLDSLVIPAQIHHDKDSLLRLAKMSKQERNAIIDKKIEEVKKKEQAERKKAYQEENLDNSNFNSSSSTTTMNDPMNSFEKGKFYFYNRNLLARGRREFEHKWGKRKLEDFWNLRKKANLAQQLNEQKAKGLDSLEQKKTNISEEDASNENTQESLVNNPLERAFYLAQIPFSPTAQKAVKKEIGEAMLEEARILRDKLDLLKPSYKLYKEYAKLYPSSEKMDQVLYASYLLALRLNRLKEAEQYRLAYLRKYPQTELASKFSDKHYLQKLQQTDELVATYYAQAYDAYLASNGSQVERLYQKVKRAYPKSKLYPRFIFLSAMAKVIKGEENTFRKRLEELKGLKLDKETLKLAQAMLTELKNGRHIVATSSTGFKTQQNTEEIIDNSDINKTNFKLPENDRNYSLVIALPNSLVSEAQLIYYVSLYNFVHYTQDNLELKSLSSDKFSALMIKRFRTLNDAEEYVKELYQGPELKAIKSAIHSLVSLENSQQISSLNDYHAYLNFLSKDKKQQALAKEKLNYLNNPPIVEQNRAEEKALEKAKQAKKKLKDESIKGKEAQKAPISYENMEALAKERAKEKERLARERAKAKKTREKARRKEREAKLKERRRQQKAKLKARERERKAKLKERRRKQKEKERERRRRAKEKKKKSSRK